jgi:predicted DNA binding CopG/RHH family protein
MQRKKSSKPDTGRIKYPQFKTREQEYAWYEANKERLMEDLMRYGKMVPARIVEKTQLLTLRLPVADIERAREIAEKQGIGYQTVLKQALREGLKKAG